MNNGKPGDAGATNIDVTGSMMITDVAICDGYHVVNG